MEAVLFTSLGATSGAIALHDNLFARPVKMGLIHRLLLLQRNNARIAIAHTLNRGERRGSTRKLGAQKGSGKARQGSIRSPVHKKWGVLFGPRNTDNWSVSMNKKERQLALFSLLSSKAKDSAVKVVESFDPNASKTKELSGIFSKMGVKSAVVAVLPTEKHVFEGGRNIAAVKVIGVNYLNPRDLLKYKELVFTKASLEYIVSLYS